VTEIPAPDIRNTVSNMTPIKVNISLDADTLRVALNDVPRLVRTVNLISYFSGGDVYVGFTGGAGATANQQDIFTWTMNSVAVRQSPPLVGNPKPGRPRAKDRRSIRRIVFPIFVRIVRDTWRVLIDTQYALSTSKRGK
jgi:hypothetical protein